MRVPDMSPKQIQTFWSNYSTWQNRVVEAFRQSHPDAVDADIISSLSTNMHDLLDAVPAATRKELMNQYRALIGFDDVMAQALAQPGAIREIGTDKNIIRRLSIDRGQINSGNPLAIIFNSLNIQHDPTRPLRHKASAMDAYFFGKNLMGVGAAQEAVNVRSTAQKFASGSKVFIFDTETVGLAADIAGVREVAGSTYRMVNGSLEAEHIPTARFKTAGMHFGAIWDDESASVKSLADVFDKGVIGAAGDGDKFAEKLIPFLHSIIEADQIAGHNVEFDIRQTLMNLRRTSAYHHNAEIAGVNIRELVDQAVTKVQSPGALIDTRHLLMQSLPNLGLAPELGHLGRLAPYGLENVLLNTNLAKLMIRDMGDEAAQEFFVKGGQHTAEYDTRITASLLQYLSSGELKQSRLGRRGILGTIRTNTIKASAIVPTATIKDVNHLDPALFRELVESGSDPRFRIMQSTKDGKVISADLSKHSTEDWLKILRDPTNRSYFLDSGVSYLEQEIWANRQARAGVTINAGADMDSIISGLGEWRRFSGVSTPYEGLLNADSTLFKMGTRPNEHAFSKMVDSMAALGNPFAALSMPERMLTGALSMASSINDGAGSTVNRALGALGKGTSRAAEYADDLGLIHFAAQEQITGTSRIGQHVSLPLSILEEAERQNVLSSRFLADDGKPQMLQLSPFRSDADNKVVNLRYQLDEGGASDLADWVRGLTPESELGGRKLADYGLTDLKSIETLAHNIMTSGAENGITVGFLDKQAGTAGYDAITSLFGTDRDVGRAPIRVAFGQQEGGVIRTGPAILDRFLDDQGYSSIRQGLNIASERFSKVAEHFMDDRAHKAFRRKQVIKDVTSNMSQIGTKLAEGDFKSIYSAAKASKGVRRGAIGAGLALGAYYLVKRRQRREPYLEPFDQMPIEGQSHRQPDQYPAPSARSSLDPLSTAGVTGFYDANRTSHEKMGSDKYASLFGGAI